MLIKPAFVLTAGHVVGIQVGPYWVANPAITTYGTKVCHFACTWAEIWNMPLHSNIDR